MDIYQDRADRLSRPSGNIRSPSNMTGASTIVGSMKATDFPSDEKGFQDGGNQIQRFSRGESDPHKDISQNPDGDSTSLATWEKNLNQETRNAKERSDGWAQNADSVLTFTGLFAVVVVTFLLLSFPLLQRDPADTTNQLLTQISQQSSLALSMACALLATLVQQWARSFKQAADKAEGDYRLSQRVRIYAFFFVGVERFALPVAVELIPVLLHSSVLLFFGGLSDFLINVNHAIGYMMTAMVATGFLVYSMFTIMPLVIPNSPYRTPLSSIWWYIVQLTIYFGLCLCQWLPIYSVPNSIYKYRTKIWKGMRLALESKAIQSTSREKPHDDDHDLEEFLKWVHRLFYLSAWFKSQYSMILREGLEHLVTPVADKLFATCLLLEDPDRSQRLETCLKAIWCFSRTVDRHFQAIRKRFDNLDDKTNDPWGPLSAETWKMALNMTTDSDPFVALRAQCIQALMVVMWKENRWQCTPHDSEEYLRLQLGASDDMIKGWTKSGDQLQFAIAANLLSKSLPLLRKLETGAHKTRRIELKEILDAICRNLDTSNVPPELQARFVDSAEVSRVFSFDPNELSGPWTSIFNNRTPVRAPV